MKPRAPEACLRVMHVAAHSEPCNSAERSRVAPVVLITRDRTAPFATGMNKRRVGARPRSTGVDRRCPMTAPELTGGADISEDGLYRYRLWRDWGDADGPRVCWVMLNPSVADAAQDDPTIRRCIRFSRAWGAHGMTVVNLFAWRATNPRDLIHRPSHVSMGEGNNDVIADAAARARLVICAWGSPSDTYVRKNTAVRARDVARILRHRDLHCLGTAKDGQPRHPLYLAANLTPVAWRGPHG